jgi:elongation factor Ts
MNISRELIKKVREITGAGINNVKKALDEAGGDENKAVETLRKQGQKMAAKKAERSAKEGVIVIKSTANKRAVVELFCETDFVARNNDFQKAAAGMAVKLLEIGKTEFNAWATAKIQNELIVKIGENIQLGQYQIIEGDVIGSYLHSNNKIAGVVVLDGGAEDLAKDLAMQAVAMNPLYIGPEDIPGEVIEKEKEIYREQLKAEGKPVEMIEKIIMGKLQKFYNETCLIKQNFIKDDKITVEQLLNGVKVVEFAIFAL